MSADDDLPEGWQRVLLPNLGELARGKSKHRPRNDPALFGNTAPFIQTGDVAGSTGRITSYRTMYSEFGVKQSRIFPRGTVCITIAANIAETAILTFPACFPDSVVGFVADPHKTCSEFIEYFIRVARADLKRFAPATAQANINLEILGQVQVPVPPLPEQRRIVAKLESLQARSRRAREALEAVPPLLEKLRQSILAAAFRGDLTKDWREKHPDVEPASKLLKRIRVERRKKWEEAELAKMKAKGKVAADDKWKAKYVEPEPVDDSELPELPEGWCWAAVPELFSLTRVGMRTGPFGSLMGREDYVDDGIPIIGVENIGRMVFRTLSKHHIAPARAADLADYSAEPGDVIVSRSGTVGEVCIVPDNCKNGIISTNTMRISVAKEFVSPDFIGFCLIGSSAVLDQIKTLCSGSTRDFLNQAIVSELLIPLAPRREQDEVCRRISSASRQANKLDMSVNSNTGELKRLDAAILSKAFRGELVPQEPGEWTEAVEPPRVPLEPLESRSAKKPGKRAARRK